MDINCISGWVNCDKLTITPTKSKTIIELWSTPSTEEGGGQFALNGRLLEQVETFRYVGMFPSSGLSWSARVDYICTKANKLIGLLYRRFCGNVGDQSLLEIYSALIHPYIEYAAPIWDPKILTNSKVFNMCLKQWDLGYLDLLSSLLWRIIS